MPDNRTVNKELIELRRSNLFDLELAGIQISSDLMGFQHLHFLAFFVICMVLQRHVVLMWRIKISKRVLSSSLMVDG